MVQEGAGHRGDGEPRAGGRSSRQAEREARRRARRRTRREQRRERKEHVLHTRISASLADDIHRLADSLRVPVSNLVRNVLEEAFSVVETVSDNVGDLVENVLDEAERISERYRGRAQERGRDEPREAEAEAPEKPEEVAEDEGDVELDEVLGWQPIVLNRDRGCAGCGTALRRGERAFTGLTERGLTGDYVCCECVAELK